MNRKSITLIACLMMAAVSIPLSTVRAQEVQVTVVPKSDPLPPQVMSYLSQPGNYFTVTLNNPSTEALNVFLTLEVEQVTNGNVHVSTPYYIQPNTPIVLAPNTSTPVTNVAMQNQFRQLETTDIVMTGAKLSDFYGPGMVGLLKEGRYKATVKVYRWQPGVQYPQLLSNPMSGSCFFNVCYSAQSPEITVPYYTDFSYSRSEQQSLNNLKSAYDKAKKAEDDQRLFYNRCSAAQSAAALKKLNELRQKTQKALDALNKKNYIDNDAKWQASVVNRKSAVFAWTSPITNCGGAAYNYSYTMEFFPIAPTHKKPETAVSAGTIALTIKNISTPSCVLTPDQISQIEKYCQTPYYVARVTALPRVTDKNNANYSIVENNGHSQLLVFRFSDSGGVTMPEDDLAMGDDDDKGSGGKNDTGDDDDEEEEPVIEQELTPAKAEDYDDDVITDYTVYAPKLTSPDISMRGILKENDKVELKWEKPELIEAPDGKTIDNLDFKYDVKIYKKESLQSPDQAMEGKAIYTKESLNALQHTITWSDLKDIVKVNDNLVYAVTANCLNETSVKVTKDNRNIYQQSYADLSDKSAGMAPCYPDAIDNIKDEDRVFAMFTEKELRDMEVQIGEFPLTLVNANADTKKESYSGKGYVTWKPFGKDSWPLKINVEFEGLKINDKKIVYEGEVKSCKEEDPALASYIPYDMYDDCSMSQYLSTGSVEAMGNKLDQYLKDDATLGEYYEWAQKGARIISDVVKKQVSVNLPVGLPINGPMNVQILSATFSPTTAAISVMGMFAMPNTSWIDSDVAIFGAPRICIQPESFAPNGMTIALLSDFTIRDPESDITFSLKAPTDFVALNDGCSMTFSDNGVDSLTFDAMMTIPGLLKADDNGKIIPNQDPAIEVRAFIKDWDNWMGTIRMDNFQVEEAQGFTFMLGGKNGISYDHCRSNNVKGFTLPKSDGAVEYDAKAAGCDKDINNWQGLYVDKLGVLLPSFFDDEEGGNVEISVNNLYWDDSGVSLTAAVKGSKSAPIVAAHTSKAGGWGISLESVNLNVISNNFASTSIVGGLTAPIIGGEWEYKTSFSMANYKKQKGKGLDILFTMDPREDPSFDFFLAQLELNKENTHFMVHNFEEETEVEMTLAGKITIGGLEDLTKKIPLDFSISGVEFAGMRLANFAPEKKKEQSEAASKKFSYTFDPICEGKEKGDLWFTLGTWSLASPSKQLGPFNFSLDHFGVASKKEENTNKDLTGINIVGTVGLLGETFVATAGITVWADLNLSAIKGIDDINKVKVDYKETTLDEISISSEFGGCKVAGSLKFVDDTKGETKKKGYSGSLDFTLPGDLFTMKAAGGFYNCTDEKGKFMSAYFEAQVGGATGIPLGPVQLNEIAGGFYFNTSLSNTDGTDPLKWTKTVARDVHGGMFGLGISTAGSDRGMNAKVKMIVVYDAAKNRLSTFRMNGKIHALCVAPQAEDGLINADCSIVYQNLPHADGGKFFQINITVDASGDMDDMCEAFLGTKIELPDITAGLEELEDKNEKKNRDAKETKAKVSCGVHLALDFKVTMRADDEPASQQTKWHLYLGQPGDGTPESEQKSRCSITLIDFQAGGKDDAVAVWGKIWANAYLCIGNELPNDGQLPKIPTEITNFLDGDQEDQANKARNSAAGQFNGKGTGGVMFGAQAGGKFGVNAVVCYARASLVAGFDIVLTQLAPGTMCNGRQAGGKGGFYGTGQVYALAKGELGLMLNLWIFKGKIPLIDVGLGALLKGGFPNPSWAYGKVKAKCSLFGGLIKFNGSLTMEVGEVCFPDAGNPLDDVQIFGDMTPGKEEYAQGWADQAISCYATLGFTTNMKIGTRLDLLDKNVANKLAGADGDPESYYGQACRSYKFYLDPQAELYNYGGSKPSSDRTTGGTLQKVDYTTTNMEDYVLAVPDGKLKPNAYYRLRMMGYAKEIVNGREVNPVFNDASTNFKNVNKEWRDTISVFFHSDKLPNNLYQDVKLKMPDNGTRGIYTNEFKNPEMHLSGSRASEGDDIFDPVKYDIRARLLKRERNMWVPADVVIKSRSDGYAVDDNGNVDYFTMLNADGSVAQSQIDPFSGKVQKESYGKYEDTNFTAKTATGVAAERLQRRIGELTVLLNKAADAVNDADKAKYMTLKWIPTTYHSLEVAREYYYRMLDEDYSKYRKLGLKSISDSLKMANSRVWGYKVYYETQKVQNGQTFERDNADWRYTDCPTDRTLGSSYEQKAQKSVTKTNRWNYISKTLLESGVPKTASGWTSLENGYVVSSRLALGSLNPAQTDEMAQKINGYYKSAIDEYNSMVVDAYCTTFSRTVKYDIIALKKMAHEADSLAAAVKVVKALRADVWNDRITILGLIADGRQYANPSHTLQQYLDELQKPLKKMKEADTKAASLYSAHDYTKDISVNVQLVEDSVAAFTKYVQHQANEEGARGAAAKARAEWESAVSYMASPTFASASAQTNYDTLKRCLDNATSQYEKAKAFTTASTYTNEAQGYVNAISDSISGLPSLAEYGVKAYVKKAKDAASMVSSDSIGAVGMANSHYFDNATTYLEKCYSSVDVARNASHDAQRAFGKYRSMKTDYTQAELSRQSESMRNSIQIIKNVCASLDECEKYVAKAEKTYESTVAKVDVYKVEWYYTDVVHTLITSSKTGMYGILVTAATSVTKVDGKTIRQNCLTRAESVLQQIKELYEKSKTMGLSEDHVLMLQMKKEAVVAAYLKSAAYFYNQGTNSYYLSAVNAMLSAADTCMTWAKSSDGRFIDYGIASSLASDAEMIQKLCSSYVKLVSPVSDNQKSSLTKKKDDAKRYATQAREAANNKKGKSRMAAVELSEPSEDASLYAAVTPRSTVPGVAEAFDLMNEGEVSIMSEEAEVRNGASTPDGASALDGADAPVTDKATGDAVPEVASSVAPSEPSAPSAASKPSKPSTPSKPSAPATPSTPGIPGMPSAVAAGIISNVSAGMNAKSEASKPASSAPAAASAPAASSAPAPAVPSMPASTKPSQQTGSADFLSSSLNYHYASWGKPGNVTYYADPTSLANSKVDNIPVTYHCGDKDANGYVVERKVSKTVDQPYNWLTVDGLDLMDYLTGDVQEFELIIEQVDKVKLQAYIESQRKEESHIDEAELKDDEDFLATAGGTEVTASGNIDLSAYMANYYKEMENDGLFTTDEVTDESKITNKEASKNQDMFVQQIYSWSLNRVGTDTKYDSFAAYAKAKLVSGNKPVDDINGYKRDREGIRPLKVTYASGWSPSELGDMSDDELLTSYYYVQRNPFVWLQYVGGFAFFNGLDIKDDTDFLDGNVTQPGGITLLYMPASAPYRLATAYTVNYTNRGSYSYGGGTGKFWETWKLLNAVAPGYDGFKDYGNFVASKLIATTEDFSQHLWTLDRVMEEPLRQVSEITKECRTLDNSFRENNDKTRRARVKTWANDYKSSGGGRKLVGFHVAADQKGKGYYQTSEKGMYGPVYKSKLYETKDTRTSMAIYQPYLMAMVDWYKVRGKRGKFESCWGNYTDYTTKKAKDNGNLKTHQRYTIQPNLLATGRTVTSASAKESKKNGYDIDACIRDWQFQYKSYSNTVQSFTYEVFRANCYHSTKGPDVDLARKTGYVYEFTQYAPLSGMADKYQLEEEEYHYY